MKTETLRDIVEKNNPRYVNKKYGGGVRGCPYYSVYKYLHDDPKVDSGMCPAHILECAITDDMCKECWNQPYEPVKEEDKPVKTLRDVVAERYPAAIDDAAWGGVLGCPDMYPFLNDTRSAMTNGGRPHEPVKTLKDIVADMWNVSTSDATCPKWTDPGNPRQVYADCAACWNQPYKPNTTESKSEDEVYCYIRPTKDEYYLDIAKAVSARSTCRRRRYGAILVKDDRIIATGYNGAPRGTSNCIDEPYCERMTKKIPHGERYELCRAVHAEMNALLSAGRDAVGATLYLQGVDGETGQPIAAEPCSICKAAILNAQVDRVVTVPFMSEGKLWTTDR